MFLLQMAGEPGSGKSTLARAIGVALNAVVIDKDVLKSTLLDSGCPEELAGPSSYACMFALAESLLRQGFSVVLDSPSFYERIPAQGTAIAARLGASYRFICCVCADGAEMERRLSTRTRLRSQRAERLASTFETVFPSVSYLTIDMRQPVEHCLPLALKYLEV